MRKLHRITYLLPVKTCRKSLLLVLQWLQQPLLHRSSLHKITRTWMPAKSIKILTHIRSKRWRNNPKKRRNIKITMFTQQPSLIMELHQRKTKRLWIYKQRQVSKTKEKRWLQKLKEKEVFQMITTSHL